jgi:hypothetical protein
MVLCAVLLASEGITANTGQTLVVHEASHHLPLYVLRW